MLFLNVAGIPYPDVDVDQVRALSRDVHDFATDIRESFDAATNTLGDMGSAMSGNSYQAILVVWSHRGEMMAELDSALEFTATALDISADVIEAIQIAVLIELAALAASFVAGMFTPAGPVTGPMIAAAARWLLKKTAETIMWYVANEVTSKALEPLLDKLDQLIRDTLLPPDVTLPSSPGVDTKYYLDPDAAMRYVKDLEDHADKIASHGEKFNDKLDHFDFTTPGLEVPAADWPYPGTDQPLILPPQPGTLPSTLPNWVPEMMRNLPDWLPDMQQPGLETPAGKGADANSSPSGGQNAGSATDPAGAPRPGAESQHSATTASGPSADAPPPGASVEAPTSVGGPSSAGTDSSGQARISPDEGSTGDRHDIGQSSDRTGAGSTQHEGGAVGGMVPSGAAQSAGASTPGQAQPAPAQNNSQRPGDNAANNAANKAQSGAGRGPAGPSASQSSSGPPRATPWSRGGKKAARVEPAAERDKVTAATPGDAGDRGGAVETTRPDADGAQVFAPDTEIPPAGPQRDEETGSEEKRDVSAEFVPTPAEPAGSGSRRSAPE